MYRLSMVFCAVLLFGCVHNTPSAHPVVKSIEEFKQPCPKYNFYTCAIERYNAWIDRENALCWVDLNDERICRQYVSTNEHYKSLINQVYNKVQDGDKYPMLLASGMDIKGERACKLEDLRAAYLCKTEILKQKIDIAINYMREQCTETECKP